MKPTGRPSSDLVNISAESVSNEGVKKRYSSNRKVPSSDLVETQIPPHQDTDNSPKDLNSRSVCFDTENTQQLLKYDSLYESEEYDSLSESEEYDSLSESDKKKHILGVCKEIYLNGVSAKSYPAFHQAISQPMKDVINKANDLGCEDLRNPSLLFSANYTLSPYSFPTAANKKNKKEIPTEWDLDFNKQLDNFIKYGEEISIEVYKQFLQIHQAICVMERHGGNNIRITMIDSVGTPYIKSQKRYGGYLGVWSAPVFDCAKKNKDLSFEVGLLKTTSQNDSMHCNAWLAEFIRKTKDFPALTNQLWRHSSDIDKKSIPNVFREDCTEKDNLRCCFLNKLPVQYMMAVQNPKTIQSYLDNTEDEENTLKLKSLLDKEVLPGLKVNGKEIETNIHLERKSLKYVIECIAKELGVYDPELKEFFQRSSPYHQDILKFDDESTLTIAVTGTNDAPVAEADTDESTENAAVTVDMIANDSDLDVTGVLSVSAASIGSMNNDADAETVEVSTASVSFSGLEVSFDPGTDFDYLAAGETATVVINYTVTDDDGNLLSDESTLTMTVTGTNDALVAQDGSLGHI